VLDRQGVEFLADAGEQLVPFGAIVDECPDLDEFVRRQGDINLVQDGGREAVLADGDDRVKVVGGGPQLAAAGGRE
jgi:hypothetical protein